MHDALQNILSDALPNILFDALPKTLSAATPPSRPPSGVLLSPPSLCPFFSFLPPFLQPTGGIKVGE